MIERNDYLNKLIRFKDKELIKVVTGIRRCGKSTLFNIYINYLLNNGVDKNQIIRLNLEDPVQYELTDYLKLYNYIKKKLDENKMNYIFIDEVQSIPQFQKAVDGLYIQKNVDLYITGNKIADTMTSNGRKISVHTVENYLTALTESFILYKATRYDVKGKQYLKTGDKYYVSDLGLRYFLLGRKEQGRGHILENIVYLELLRRGYDVYIGKVDEYEVDFVAINSKGIEYYQVAESVRDENTLNRELRSLDIISDHYPKFLLTMDIDPETSYNGIRKINVLDWLLD